LASEGAQQWPMAAKRGVEDDPTLRRQKKVVVSGYLLAPTKWPVPVQSSNPGHLGVQKVEAAEAEAGMEVEEESGAPQRAAKVVDKRLSRWKSGAVVSQEYQRPLALPRIPPLVTLPCP
jgi:hypothetical protein